MEDSETAVPISHRLRHWRRQMARRGRSSRGKTSRKGSLETRVNSSGYQQFKDHHTGSWTLTHRRVAEKLVGGPIFPGREDRKSTRLNSSHLGISYAVFCLKKKKKRVNKKS